MANPISLSALPRKPAPWVEKTGEATTEFYRFIVGLFGLASNAVPTGAVMDFLGPPPAGWLALDGSSHPVATYPALAAFLGYPATATTFTLPNTINTFSRSGAVAGLAGGSSTAALTAQNLPLAAASNVTAGAAAGGVAAAQAVAFSIVPSYVTYIRAVKT
jgi:microcystin-dependent protein